jgi:hypothetical protein
VSRWARYWAACCWRGTLVRPRRIRRWKSASMRTRRGRNDLAGNAECRQLPIQDVTGRTGFVAGLQLVRRTQLCHQFANRFQAVRDNAKRTNFSVRLGYRSCDGVRVDIQTKKAYFRHATNSVRMRLCAAGFSIRRLTRATANWWLVAPL